MSTKVQELAKIETYAALEMAPHDVADMLMASGGGQRISPFDLDVVKTPSGQGAAAWTIQTLEGEDSVKTLDGIIILARTIRSYWAKGLEESGGGSPPDCSSQGGAIGIGAPEAHPMFKAGNFETRFDVNGDEIQRGRFACGDCPYAEFGSDAKGRGQACKQNLLLFMLGTDSVIPMVIKVPASSIKPVRNFIMRTSGRGIPMHGMAVSLGLNKVKNSTGIAYFEIVPSFVRRLDEAETVKTKALRETLMPVLTGVRVEADI